MLTSIGASGLAIVLSFVLFCVLCYKNFGSIAAAVLCAAVVALTCLSGFHDGFFSLFVAGTMSQAQKIFFSFFFGAVFGEVLNATGGARSISAFCVGKFGVGSAPYIVMLLSALLNYVGVGSSMFICAYISFSLFRKANLPRTIACVAIAGVTPLINATAPGNLQVVNVVASSVLGSSLYSGAAVGIVTTVVGMVLMALYLRKMTNKAKQKLQGYVPFEGEEFNDDDAETPPVIFPMIALVMVAALCMICNLGLKWDSVSTAVTSLVIPCIFLLITCKKYMKGDVFKLIDGASRICLYPLIGTCAVVGFASVVTDTTAYNTVINALMSWRVNPYIICAVGAAVVAALCADAVGGSASFLSMMGRPLVEMGANLGVIHRVCTLATSTFNSLPHAGAVVTSLAVMRCTHKECYKDIAIVTIGIPIIYTIVGVIVAIVFF